MSPPTVRYPFQWEGLQGDAAAQAAQATLRQLAAGPPRTLAHLPRMRLAPDALPAQAAFADALAHSIWAGGSTVYVPQLRQRACYSYNALGQPTLAYLAAPWIVPALAQLVHIRRRYPKLPPLLLAIGAFANFIAIHPFMDGNGRCARHLLTSLLRLGGLAGERPLPLAYLMYRDRQRHLQALQPWIVEGRSEAFLQYALQWVLAAAEFQLLLE